MNQTPGQPQNNDTPGTSTTWNTIFNRAVLGQAIPVPYHDIKITESADLATATAAYQAFLAGGPASALPDLRDIFKTSRLFEIAGIAARPGLDGAGIVTAMCTQCHNSRLDQSITRARWSNGALGIAIGVPLGLCVNCSAPVFKSVLRSGRVNAEFAHAQHRHAINGVQFIPVVHGADHGRL